MCQIPYTICWPILFFEIMAFVQSTRDRSGKPPTLVQALSMGELRNRIMQHMPPQPEKQNLTVKRSLSVGGLSADYDHLEDLEVDDPGRVTVPHRRLM